MFSVVMFKSMCCLSFSSLEEVWVTVLNITGPLSSWSFADNILPGMKFFPIPLWFWLKLFLIVVEILPLWNWYSSWINWWWSTFIYIETQWSQPRELDLLVRGIVLITVSSFFSSLSFLQPLIIMFNFVIFVG